MVSNICRPREAGRLRRSIQSPTPSSYLQAISMYQNRELTPKSNRISAFFKKYGWMSPQDGINNIYAFAHKTIGPTIWGQLKINPVYLAGWNTARSAQNLANSLAISILPSTQNSAN